MKPRAPARLLGCCLNMALIVSACSESQSPEEAGSPASARLRQAPGTITTVVTGLNDPRGLAFSPDGELYIAEAGTGGTTSTVGQCLQAPFPVGPATGGPTARISRVRHDGTRVTVVDGLPSSRDNPLAGGTVQGVADVEFIGNTLYALIAGAGCSHGNPGTVNGVIQVNRNGSWEQVTDHSGFLQTHQVTAPDSTDIAPDGSPYDMVRLGDGFYVAEANQAQITYESVRGDIRRVADFTAQVGNLTPTALALRGSHLFAGNLGKVPFFDGSSTVFAISSRGEVTARFTGLTTILGLEFSRTGRLYALETSVGKPVAPPFLFPATGRVVRMESDGTLTPIATELNLPTAMTMGPEGDLYVSVCGFGCPREAGTVIRIGLED